MCAAHVGSDHRQHQPFWGFVLPAQWVLPVPPSRRVQQASWQQILLQPGPQGLRLLLVQRTQRVSRAQALVPPVRGWLAPPMHRVPALQPPRLQLPQL
jgi:hypothetical protein